MRTIFIPLIVIIIFYLIPTWKKLKLRDKLLHGIFLFLLLIIILMDLLYPKGRISVWQGRLIGIGFIIILFMISIAISEFISLKKPETNSKIIVLIASGIPIIILIFLGIFIAWHYYTRYLPSLK